MCGNKRTMTFRQPLRFACLGLVILLMGAACSNGQNADTDQQTITEDTVVPTTRAQKAHAFCVSRGNRFIIKRTDTGYDLFCEFQDQSRCEAFEFLDRECTIDSAEPAMEPTPTADIDDIFAGPRFCDPVAEPVCGVDGRTYTNACIATQQLVAVEHSGTCSSAIEPSEPPTVPEPERPGTGNTTQNNDAISSTPPPAPPIYTDKGIPDWIAVPFSLIEDNPSIESAYAARCPSNGQNYYLIVENCDTCFSTLYNEQGDLVCNPTNDLNGTCPAAFGSGQAPACTVLLEK